MLLVVVVTITPVITLHDPRAAFQMAGYWCLKPPPLVSDGFFQFSKDGFIETICLLWPNHEHCCLQMSISYPLYANDPLNPVLRRRLSCIGPHTFRVGSHQCTDVYIFHLTGWY